MSWSWRRLSSPMRNSMCGSSAVLGPPGRVMLHARVAAARERVQQAVDDIDICLGFRGELTG